jgi:hypothetical protein
VNKFAVLAASLVASFALAFAVYSAESNTNTSMAPRVLASVRLTNQTQAIPTTTLFSVSRTGLYRVSSYMALTTPGTDGNYWSLCLGWTDEAGVEMDPIYSLLNVGQGPPNAYGMPDVTTNAGFLAQPPFPIEALSGTPITYAVNPFFGGSGTYELFLTVEGLQ